MEQSRQVAPRWGMKGGDHELCSRPESGYGANAPNGSCRRAKRDRGAVEGE
jgi:hypothetical protein